MNQATNAHRRLLLVGLIFLSGALALKADALHLNETRNEERGTKN